MVKHSWHGAHTSEPGELANVPAAHGMQVEDPVVLENVPSGQGRQLEEPTVLENVPTGQGVHLPAAAVFASEYVPVGQRSHFALFHAEHLSWYPLVELHDSHFDEPGCV